MVLVLVAVVTASCASQPVADTAQPSSPDSTIVAAPTEPSNAAPVADARARLEAARERWAAAALGTYTYRFLDDCGECNQLPQQTVVVWDGELMDPLGRVASVEEAFALIDDAISRGTEVDVEYDPVLGYPTDLWIDQEARAYDGGVHLMYEAVEPGLPGNNASLDLHRQARARWDATGIDSYDFTASIVCDCEVEAVLETRVVDGLVTSFDAETPEPTDATFSPLTIVQLFDDLEDIIEGQQYDGVFVTGSALYDDRLGYPIWVGLDIEVTDPDAVDGITFPPRLVVAISDVEPLRPEPQSDLELARAKWESAALGSYAFDIVFHDVDTADFTEAFSVTVEDGVIVTVSENGYEYPPEDVEVPTIDEMFDAIAEWQFDGLSVDVIYDAEFGHPAVVVAQAPDGSSTTVSISLRR